MSERNTTVNYWKPIALTGVGFILGSFLSPVLNEIGMQAVESLFPPDGPSLAVTLIEDNPDVGLHFSVTNHGDLPTVIHAIRVCVGDAIFVVRRDSRTPEWLYFKDDASKWEIRDLLHYGDDSEWIAGCHQPNIPRFVSGNREVLAGRTVEVVYESIPGIRLDSTVLDGFASGNQECSVTLNGSNTRVSRLLLCRVEARVPPAAQHSSDP